VPGDTKPWVCRLLIGSGDWMIRWHILPFMKAATKFVPPAMQNYLSGGNTAINCTNGRTGPLRGAQSSSSVDKTSFPMVALFLLPPVACFARSEMRGA